MEECIKLTRITEPHASCELCERHSSLLAGARFPGGAEKPTWLCRECLLDSPLTEGDREWLESDEFKMRLSSAFALAKMRGLVQQEEDVFARYPSFRNALIEFRGDHFKLASGEQDEMLASIAAQHDSGRALTEKQITAFVHRCDMYAEQRMEGQVLVDPATTRQKGAYVEHLLKESVALGKACFEDGRFELVISFAAQYEQKGYLSEKQLSTLERLHKKANRNV